jgi:hypothetical protein
VDRPAVRRAALAIAVLFLALWVRDWVAYLVQPDRALVAVDYRLYMDATARWLAGGPFFEPYQLAGPYTVTPGDILYPPTALPLFVVFTLLPALLWWAVPIAGTTLIVARHRPNALAIAAMAICLWFPATNVKLLTGNPVLWAVLAVAAGTVWAWPGVFVLIKPSLFPFAVIDARRRSWWVALVLYGLLALAFAPMMRDWLVTVANARNPGGLLYSVQEVPMMAIPVLAWLGRRPTMRSGVVSAGDATGGGGQRPAPR